jgi:hypothetical protein
MGAQRRVQEMVLKKQRERVKEGVIPARTISDRKQGLQCAPPQAAEQIGSCGDPTTLSPALSALKKPTKLAASLPSLLDRKPLNGHDFVK